MLPKERSKMPKWNVSLCFFSPFDSPSLFSSSIDASVFDIDPASEQQLFQCAKEHIKQPIDRIVNGIGVRLYNNGKKYQGHFENNVRHGFGTFYDTEKKCKDQLYI